MNVLFKAQNYIFCLKSKIHTLVTIDNIWNSEEKKEPLGEDLDCTGGFLEACVTLIYVLNTCEARNDWNSLPLSGQQWIRHCCCCLGQIRQQNHLQWLKRLTLCR